MNLKFDSVISLVFLTFALTLLEGCSNPEDQEPKQPKPISLLSQSEAETLLQQCYEMVSSQQENYANKLDGKTEPIGRNTDPSYKIKLPSKSYLPLELRLKHFARYKTLNLNFAFWGSERTTEGHLSRYVVVWYCTTDGHKITKTRRGPKVKLAQ